MNQESRQNMFSFLIHTLYLNMNTKHLHENLLCQVKLSKLFTTTEGSEGKTNTTVLDCSLLQL